MGGQGGDRGPVGGELITGPPRVVHDASPTGVGRVWRVTAAAPEPQAAMHPAAPVAGAVEDLVPDSRRFAGRPATAAWAKVLSGVVVASGVEGCGDHGGMSGDAARHVTLS